MALAARRVTGAKDESIHGMARRVYDDAGRNIEKAIDAVILQIRKYPRLHEQAYRIAAETLVGKIVQSDRQRVYRGEDIGEVAIVYPAPPTDTVVPLPSERSPAAIQASAKRLSRVAVRLTGLYLAKLRLNGEEFFLGNATPAQLRAVAAQRYGQGSTMVREARWLEKIAASAKDDLPIHKSVSLKQLERLQKEALETAV